LTWLAIALVAIVARTWLLLAGPVALVVVLLTLTILCFV
jgi:hypothetical protein